MSRKLIRGLILSEDQNIVYIGRKPVMSYVLAVITYFNAPDAKEIVLQAGGEQ